MSQLCERDVEIVNRQGLHARPVMKIVDLATSFSSKIRIGNGQTEADATAPMEMMLLAAPQGTRLRLAATGNDAEAAVAAIAELIAAGFQED